MKYFVFILLFLAISPAFCQEQIRTLPVFKGRSAFAFSNEWQYLSSDIYLFNVDAFEPLVNEIAKIEKEKKGKKWRWKKDTEYIEYLFITAGIKDVKFFGENLIYPIFNFQIENKDKKYKTSITASSEEIRIIDNLPLASTNDLVEAEIVGEIVTSKQRNKFNNLIASQLSNIALISNPSAAVLKLVGELGEFMKSKSKGKQYRFSSTIRLYEGQNFNERLHSINIYVFTPSNLQKVEINTEKLRFFLDSTEAQHIDFVKITDLIDYREYPYIVVANYKSKYETEPVIGDQINFEYIEKRRSVIKEAYENELISKDTYVQELELIEFLDAFAQLKLNINAYKLNYDSDVSNSFAKNYYLILRDYRELRMIYNMRLREFRASKLFANQFKSKYESILVNAQIYLEGNTSLRNIRELVNTLFEFETNHKKLTSDNREAYLRKLYAVDLPEKEKASEEMKDIRKIIQILEADQYRLIFAKKVKELNKMSANEKTLTKKNELLVNQEATNCLYCREKMNEAILGYNARYENYLLENAKLETRNIVADAKDKLYYSTKKESCIKQHFRDDYPDEVPTHIKFLQDELNELSVKIIETMKTIDIDIITFSLEQIREHNNDIQNRIHEIKDGLERICKKEKALCDCE